MVLQIAQANDDSVSFGCNTEPYTLERVLSVGFSEGRMPASGSGPVIECFKGERGRDVVEAMCSVTRLPTDTVLLSEEEELCGRGKRLEGKPFLSGCLGIEVRSGEIEALLDAYTLVHLSWALCSVESFFQATMGSAGTVSSIALVVEGQRRTYWATATPAAFADDYLAASATEPHGLQGDTRGNRGKANHAGMASNRDCHKWAGRRGEPRGHVRIATSKWLVPELRRNGDVMTVSASLPSFLLPNIKKRGMRQAHRRMSPSLQRKTSATTTLFHYFTLGPSPSCMKSLSISSQS